MPIFADFRPFYPPTVPRVITIFYIIPTTTTCPCGIKLVNFFRNSVNLTSNGSQLNQYGCCVYSHYNYSYYSYFFAIFQRNKIFIIYIIYKYRLFLCIFRHFITVISVIVMVMQKCKFRCPKV